MGNPLYGFATQLSVDTVSTPTVRLDFQSEGLVENEQFLDTNGLRGTRSRSVEREMQAIRPCAGPLKFEPTSTELSYLLQWIMGGTVSGTSYPLGDALSSRYVVIARDNGTLGKVFTYNGAVVDKARFTARQGEALSVELDVCAVDESVANAGTFPSLSLDITTHPLAFWQAVITINSVAYNAPEFTLEIDNVVDKQRFFNSQTVTALQATDRHVNFSTRLPYGEATAAYGLGAAGVACSLVLTNANEILTFTLPKVCFPRKGPPVQSRNEVFLPMSGVCLKSGSSTLEMSTTLVLGP